MTKWLCRKCGAEMTLHKDKLLPLRLFRPANACERFPHKWEKLHDPDAQPDTERGT